MVTHRKSTAEQSRLSTPTAENSPPVPRSRRRSIKTPSGAPENSHHQQRAAILSVLATAKGGWVPLSEIAECSEFWGVRIHELRQRGFTIGSKGLGSPHAFFRLGTGEDVESEPGVALNAAAADASTFPGSAAEPERYLD
jgi:hypothetical protein